MKTAFVSGFLCASLLPALAPLLGPVLVPQECENIHQHEPILLYEVSGATLAGQVDRTLTVFSDGTLKLAFAEPGEPGTCRTAQATPDEAGKLQQALLDAGAGKLCDGSVLGVDLPLHTLTYVRGLHEVSGRTFSWWNPEEGYGALEVLLENFVAVHFPT